MNPKLTTVNVDKELLGKRAVSRIRYQIEHDGAMAENTVIGVRMIERNSVLLTDGLNAKSDQNSN